MQFCCTLNMSSLLKRSLNLQLDIVDQADTRKSKTTKVKYSRH